MARRHGQSRPARAAATAQPAGGLRLDDPRHVLELAAVALLAVILLPGVVEFLPVLYFDVDPRSPVGRSPVTAFGPLGAAWLQVISVLIASAGVAVSVWAGGRVRWGACTLVGVGVLACLYHLPGHLDNRLVCGAWVASAAVGLAVLHLAQHEPARRWLAAGMVALLIPMALHAVWFIYVEHPATVASFHANEAAFLQSRGWTPGSPEHELYVRRLESPDAVGTFGLANVLGTVALGLTLVAAGWALGLWRAGVGRVAVLVGAAAAGLGVWVVMLTHSKGAAAALLLGGVLLGGAAGAFRWLRMRHVLPLIAAACVVLAVVAVLMRGSLGPPDSPEGERSLLFRFYYWQAAARLVSEHLPASAGIGIGPAGFSSGYLHAKNPLSPEEVTSAHNVFVDFITTLGVGGWAWSILLLLWLWQAGRSVARASTAQAVADEPVQSGPDSAEDEAQVRRRCLLLAAILGGVIFGTQRVVESQKMWIDTAILWLIGLVGFIGVSAGLVIWRGAGRRDGRWLGTGLWAGAAAVLTHSQIEMAFYQPASSGLVWAMMALAAGPFCPVDEAKTDAARPRWRIYLPAGVIACAGIALLFNVKPLAAHQQSLARAAQAIQEGFPIRALEELDRAGAVIPSDLRAMRWRALLRLEWAAAAMQQHDPSTARRRIEEALAILEQARSSPNAPPAADRLYASVQEQAAQWLHEPDRLSLAVEAIQRAIRQSPYSLADHLRLGDGLWELGRRDEAAAAYRRALELSEQNYLDPARQLHEADRQRILDHLNTASTPQ